MKLKMGVIGIGFAWDRLHFPSIKELSNQYEIVAVCNKSIDKAKGFAQSIGLGEDRIYSDYKELLKRSDIDVVDLLVPISENFEIARDVLLTGKNLIAEKPFAATIEGAKELIEIKNKNQLKVMVAENFRYDEGNAIIKQLLQRGEIGEVAYFIYHTGADFQSDQISDTFSAKEWRQHPLFEGGSFLDGGIHDIALMRFLFGDTESVSTFARPQEEDYCKYMNINCLMKFKNGVIGNYTYYSAGRELQKPPIGLRIFGTKGEIYLESKESGMVNISYKDGRSGYLSYTPQRGYYQELLNFYEGNLISTPEKELGDIELIFEILERVKG